VSARNARGGEAAADVWVIGAGPAGLSAALWCAELGLRPRVVEAAAEPGGQLLRIPTAVTNLPGMPPQSGRSLLHTLLAQLAERDVDVCCDARWSLDSEPDVLAVRDSGGRVVPVPAVILATGVRRRRLGVPGETGPDGATLAGVHDNVGPDLARWRDQHVVIVGGGDDALEHVALLAPVARQVTLLHRSSTFRARPALLEPVLAVTRPAHANLTVRTGVRITELLGGSSLAAIRVDGETVRADALFRCIGPEPDTADHGVPRHPDGAIDVDVLQRSRRQGVFAVGDACSVESPTLSTAFGHGSTAAKALLAWRSGAPWRGVVLPTRAVAPTATPADRLRVENLELPARVGVYARERESAQPLRFTLEFAIDAARAARADALADTLDYASAAACVEEVLAAGHFNLVETIATRVADALLGRFAVTDVGVRVAKLGVPRPGAQAVVEVWRSRA
jgi:thioredoxin reductase (NADPH)